MIKKLLTIFFFVLISLIAIVGCSKPESLSNMNNDEYYIKYLFEAKNNIGYTRYWNCNISFTGEKGQEEMEFLKVSKLSYEVVTGPFRYGKKVFATLDGGGFPNISIQVFVSKNGSPFALKGMESGSRLEYVIDF